MNAKDITANTLCNVYNYFTITLVIQIACNQCFYISAMDCMLTLVPATFHTHWSMLMTIVNMSLDEPVCAYGQYCDHCHGLTLSINNCSTVVRVCQMLAI